MLAFSYHGCFGGFGGEGLFKGGDVEGYRFCPLHLPGVSCIFIFYVKKRKGKKKKMGAVGNMDKEQL